MSATLLRRTAASSRGEIRAFREEDAPEVAALNQRAFLRTYTPPSSAFISYFVDVFLRHPWSDPELPSYVYVAPDGAIRGFIGVIPVRMSYRGRPMRAAVSASVSVDAAKANPLAAALLLKTFFQGPQDLSIGDNTTDVIRRMSLAFGAKTVPLNGLRWTRNLRLGGLTAYLAAQRIPRLRALRAPGAALDPILARFLRREPPSPPAGAEGTDVAPEELARIIPSAVGGFALRPDFDLPALRWLLAHAARKECRGAPLARIVTLRGGETAGGYLAHFRPFGLFEVMQVFAAPGNAEVVVDDLLARAWQCGAVAVIGRNQPELMEALQLRDCAFRHGGFTVAHSRSPEIADAVARGHAFLNGLVGEAWTRLNGGDFTAGQRDTELP